MIYDIIYMYNQFIGKLPDSYAEFSREWYKLFPLTMDTKVLSYQADYFGKTILGKVFEKCQNDKRLKEIIDFKFDEKNGFGNYVGTELLSHYHEAAYDAYMTGYAFAKVLKYKEIDELYHKKKMMGGKKGKQKEGEDKNQVDPDGLKDTEINFEHHFYQCFKNQVMMNQFDDCACYNMNPEKGKSVYQKLEDKQKEVIWLKFREDYPTAEMSAETLSTFFSKFGDFNVFKDSKKSVILQFYYIDKTFIEHKSIQGIIEHLTTHKNEFHISEVCTYDQARKFVAHNHLE